MSLYTTGEIANLANVSVRTIQYYEKKKILKTEEKDILQKLNSIKLIKNSVLDKKNLPVNSLKDIETIMKRNNQLKNVHINMVIIGIIMDIITIGTLLFWIIKGIWIPFIFGMIIVIILGLISFRLYYNDSLYICPKCKELFKPTIFKFLFSYHTPKTRKLTCPKCHYIGYMIETYDEK